MVEVVVGFVEGSVVDIAASFVEGHFRVFVAGGVVVEEEVFLPVAVHQGGIGFKEGGGVEDQEIREVLVWEVGKGDIGKHVEKAFEDGEVF